MNLLKSIFISNYMTLVMAIAGYGGWMLYQGGNPIAWSGVMLTAGPLLMVITRLMLFKNVARTSAHFPLINFLAAVGVGLAAWAWYGQDASATAPALALAGWFGFCCMPTGFQPMADANPAQNSRSARPCPALPSGTPTAPP
ncbi:MAG: hypothetical protein ACXWAT_10055 [Methylobacter sp.]